MQPQPFDPRSVDPVGADSGSRSRCGQPNGFLGAGSDYQAQLDAVIGFVEADQFQELVDQVPDLLEADEEFEAEARVAVDPSLA